MPLNYISPELFHFFGRAAPADHERNYTLQKVVLRSGCISHPPHEVGWGTIAYSLDLSKRLAREQMLVPTVTCYCDSPFNLLGPHISKYGSFGLSFSRHQLTQLGARPVIYVPLRPDDWLGVFTGHTLLRELEATFRGVHEQSSALSEHAESEGVALTEPATSPRDALEKAKHTLGLRVLAYLKAYDSTLDESDPRYYYSEREWRKLGNLPFETDDVIRVLVHESYLERARDELPDFGDRICVAPSESSS
jgi:Putative abortive phage resistance protein AbiGi, antitoxin